MCLMYCIICVHRCTLSWIDLRIGGTNLTAHHVPRPRNYWFHDVMCRGTWCVIADMRCQEGRGRETLLVGIVPVVIDTGYVRRTSLVIERDHLKRKRMTVSWQKSYCKNPTRYCEEAACRPVAWSKNGKVRNMLFT
jgi:hypothetical protein